MWLGLQLVLAMLVLPTEELLCDSVLLATRHGPEGVQFPLLLHLALAVSAPQVTQVVVIEAVLALLHRARLSHISSVSTDDNGEQIDDFLISTGDTYLVLNKKKCPKEVRQPFQ